jgi:hypothetical protein
VPASSPDYAPLLADIERRLNHPASGAPPIPEPLRPRISEDDRPTSAILLNQSGRTIAALQVHWRFETVGGRSYRHGKGMLSASPLLLPFGVAQEHLPSLRYWHVILPGSKRYLSESGMVGDNTDVRLPAPEEMWPAAGGIRAGSSRTGGGAPNDPVIQVTLVLDGVFFDDGEFVGPDRDGLFGRTVAEAEVYLEIARLARQLAGSGKEPAQVLDAIQDLTGPGFQAPPTLRFRNPDATPADFRARALWSLANRFALQ